MNREDLALHFYLEGTAAETPRDASELRSDDPEGVAEWNRLRQRPTGSVAAGFYERADEALAELIGDAR